MFDISLTDQIIYGSPEGVAQLVKSGVDINQLDEYGFTPLIETAIVNNSEMAAILLAAGANTNGQDLTGRTALHWAVDNNNIELCQLLLQNGADPNLYSNAGQSPLTYPLLRNQIPLKNLLYHYHANLDFAQDFINTKLIGHRFELIGYTDIVNSKGKFIPLHFEGFFLEFTVNVLLYSIAHYRRSFANKDAKIYSNELLQIINSFKTAAQLIKYQHYLTEVDNYKNEIHELLSQKLLLLPIANEGHAISFIKYGHFFAKCDRGENSKREGSVIIYRVHNTQLFNTKFFKDFIYNVHSRKYIQQEINGILGLETLLTLPIPSQIIGNCSWANVEAAIPTMLFLLLIEKASGAEELPRIQAQALEFYYHWLRWDQDRAINECIQSFYHASPARKASKAAILANILFQKCRYTEKTDMERAKKILKVLDIKEYRYILKSYLSTYTRNKQDSLGINLLQILDHFGINP